MVAMSGGVDSSVAAALLMEQGHDIVGVHMKLHDAPAATSGASGTCCGLDDAADARRVADRLGIPFYVLDLQDAFRAAVESPFVDAWVAGRTPNPCVACNGVLKFRVLLARAAQLGCEALATGHYVRIDDDGAALRVASDPQKDQSYFMFPLTRAAIERARFPLGGLTKPEVRAHAARLGLVTASKPESMDVCFLPDHDHARHVADARPEIDPSGEIVDEDGHVLGRHEGYWRFTVGQRHGLGLARPTPVYVLRVEPETRRVVVGDADRLRHAGLRARGCTWVDAPPPGEPISVRIRHRGALIPCRAEIDGEGGVLAFFDGYARAVTPGQAAVFYRGERVLGGGWIDAALEEG
jgi:tRNA-specific 2-thiouridylase